MILMMRSSAVMDEQGTHVQLPNVATLNVSSSIFNHSPILFVLMNKQLARVSRKGLFHYLSPKHLSTGDVKIKVNFLWHSSSEPCAPQWSYRPSP